MAQERVILAWTRTVTVGMDVSMQVKDYILKLDSI